MTVFADLNQADQASRYAASKQSLKDQMDQITQQIQTATDQMSALAGQGHVHRRVDADGTQGRVGISAIRIFDASPDRECSCRAVIDRRCRETELAALSGYYDGWIYGG